MMFGFGGTKPQNYSLGRTKKLPRALARADSELDNRQRIRKQTENEKADKELDGKKRMRQKIENETRDRA